MEILLYECMVYRIKVFIKYNVCICLHNWSNQSDNEPFPWYIRLPRMKTKCTLRYNRTVAWIFLSTPVRQGKFRNWFKIVSLNTRENIHSPPEVNALVTFFHYLCCSHYILLLLHSVDYPNGECCSGPVFLWIIEEDQVSCGNTLSHDGKNTTNPGTLC